MSNQHVIELMTVDDHPLMRRGIASLIQDQADMTLTAEAATGGEAIQYFHAHQPHVTLMDLRLPDMSGVEAIAKIRAFSPNARILVLTTHGGDAEIRQSLQAGACGYFVKTIPPAELVRGIRQAHAGKSGIPVEIASQLAEHMDERDLTQREIEVLRSASSGNRNREIAETLSISEKTVKVHVQHILQKLGAIDRTHAVAIAIRRGILRV